MKRIQWNRVILLFVILVMTYVFRKFQGGFVSGFLFYTMLTVSIYELILIINMSRQVTVERIFSQKRLKAKDDLEVEITFTFPRFLPFAWLSIEDQLPERLSELTTKNHYYRLASIKKEVTFTYLIPRMPRGEHRFEKICVQVGDYFGFFQKRFEVDVPGEILVFPNYQELRLLSSLNDRNIGLTHTLNRASDDVSSLMGIRDYVYGDRMNRIHWKASAKAGELKTKEFEYLVTNDFMLFIDCEQRNDLEGNILYERSIELAASLVKYSIDRHYRIGISFYREREIVIPLARHQDHMVRLFAELGRMEADSHFSFTNYLKRTAHLLEYGTTGVIITANLSRKLVEVLLQLRGQNKFFELFWIADEWTQDEKRVFELMGGGIPVRIIDSDDFLACFARGQIRGKIS